MTTRRRPVVWNGAMSVDAAAAGRFLAAHGRLLDRRRLELALGFGATDPSAVLAALDAFANPDGGYGWGLEPDLRAPGSQPIHALHAFEVLAECGVVTPRGAALCDWLDTVGLEDGGLPFVLPIDDPTACAPWFAGADPTTSSLHGTTAVVSAAWPAARLDPAVASHPWLLRATRYCLDEIAAREELASYETMFSLRLLDAVHDLYEEAPTLLARLAERLSPAGELSVEGGLEGERLHPLDYAPTPGTAVRTYLADGLIQRDLERLAGGQQEDGGWVVDFMSSSPISSLEWRGYATLMAVDVLHKNGALTSSTGAPPTGFEPVPPP